MRHRAAAVVVIATLLAACGGGGDERGAAPSGIRGRVVAGPQCPVVTEDSPCPDEPIEGAGIEIVEAGILVATATSGAGGRFQVELEPGMYEIRAVPPSDVGMSAKPVSVTVEEGSFTSVDLHVDTGIR